MPDSAIMDRRKWLLRLIYARVVIFTLFVAGEITKGQGQTLEDLQILLFVVYGLSVCWFLVLRVELVLRVAVVCPDRGRCVPDYVDHQPNGRRRQ